jgi:hypothetical protein
MTLEADGLVVAFVLAQWDFLPVVAPRCRGIALHAGTLCRAEKNKLPFQCQGRDVALRGDGGVNTFNGLFDSGYVLVG